MANIGIQNDDPRPVRQLRGVVQQARRPIEEGYVTELVFRQVIPPPKRASGFIPRLSLGLEYNDNIFFTASQPISDYIVLLSPGLNFRHESSRLNLELDYSFESTFYADNPDLNETFEEQIGFLTTRYELGESTEFNAQLLGHAFKDPTSTLVPGVISSRETTVQGFVNLSVAHTFVPERGPILSGSFRQMLLDFEDPDSVNSTTNDLLANLQFFGTRRNRLDGELRARYFKFDTGRDVWTYAALGGGEAELAPNLHGGILVGPLFSPNDLRKSDVYVNASLRKAFRDSDMEIRYERDWTTSGGLDAVLLSQILSVSAQLRLGGGVQALVRVGGGRFESVDTSSFKIWTAQPELGVTYTATSWLLLRLAYQYSWQKQDGIDESVTSNRVLFSVVGSL